MTQGADVFVGSSVACASRACRSGWAQVASGGSNIQCHFAFALLRINVASRVMSCVSFDYCRCGIGRSFSFGLITRLIRPIRKLPTACNVLASPDSYGGTPHVESVPSGNKAEPEPLHKFACKPREGSALSARCLGRLVQCGEASAGASAALQFGHVVSRMQDTLLHVCVGICCTAAQMLHTAEGKFSSPRVSASRPSSDTYYTKWLTAAREPVMLQEGGRCKL